MGENGYIIREKNPNDRREQPIRLTLKAKTDIPFIRRAIEELNNYSVRNISEKEKLIFMEVLRNIQDNLLDIVPAEQGN